MSGISGSNALAFGSTSWASLGSAGVLVALHSSQIMRLVVYRDLDVKELVTIICLDRARYPVHYYVRVSIRDEQHRGTSMPNWRCASKPFYWALSRGDLMDASDP
ncbi:hypothetical protein F4824DRAFT_501408 [Ustulina deusta]|nr:hypothetical protein F4824DRAFT_501408 [Ustulina deusta]